MLTRFSLIFLVFISGCGYTLRGQERPFFEKKEIRTLYIPPVKNDSYKAGVEIVVYNTLRKRFAQWGYVRVVDTPETADATLSAVVLLANIVGQGTVYPKQLANGANAPSNVQIASIYNVMMTLRFELKNKKGVVLWAAAIPRAKTFQAATYFGNLGSTSALINNSLYDETLVDMAGSVISDAEEAINAVF